MKRGEIWLVNLDPTIGAEIRKTRPAIIVSNDEIGILPLRVIVPITDWKPHYSAAKWMVKLEPDLDNNLSKPSSADCFQVRSVSKERLIKKLGNIVPLQMIQIDEALQIALGI
ncbi:MAG TPA: type II toxin-antitoxin system PemK/MazF family toxin [Saprospiraceae bacterium]|nr:type II toxin-antitoxin system PemK/MazF family toxin [Saprospiraceae bacterium]HND86716.1 type II toxin-antitoxin system PemK/MazF family toxin [Saprospiraceae bacterium]HNG88775.1 type II toxin-antitoxin system PemK/MazF family toxin [Saprospiraceae bacterium]